MFLPPKKKVVVTRYIGFVFAVDTEDNGARLEGLYHGGIVKNSTEPKKIANGHHQVCKVNSFLIFRLQPLLISALPRRSLDHESHLTALVVIRQPAADAGSHNRAQSPGHYRADPLIGKFRKTSPSASRQQAGQGSPHGCNGEVSLLCSL